MRPDDAPGPPAGRPEGVLDCFESVPAILWAFEGPELRVTAANAGARASTGNRPGIIGSPLREVFPEMEGQQIFEMMEEAYAAGAPVAGEQRRVLVDLDGDGRLEERFYTYSMLPTFHPDGSVRGLVAHIVETTEAARRELAAESAAADSERRYREAHDLVLELQRSLLPDGVPVLPRLRLAAHYRVADEEAAAGGDWFDALPMPDGRVALMVGDVTGHGARAAGAMGQLRAVAVDAVMAGEEPAAVLRRLDRFAATGEVTRSATVCLAVLDPASGALVVGSHGHPPPLLVGPDGRTRFLDPGPSHPLGTGGPAAAPHEARLAPGDLLLLYTDGLVERTGRGLDETLAALARVAAGAQRDPIASGTTLPAAPPDRLAALVVDRLGFLGEGYRDDVTLLVAHVRPPVPVLTERRPAQLSALRPLRQGLARWLADVGVAAPLATAVLHAAGEAVANVVEHAYAGPSEEGLDLRAELTEGGDVRVTVADGGRWRAPAAGHTDRGRGLQMMRELMDGVRVEPGAGGTVVELTRSARWAMVLGAATGGPPAPPAEPGELEVHTDADASRVTVRGPVDLDTVGTLRTAVQRAGRGGALPLCLDLSGVTLLASSGVRLLHELVAAQPDLRFAVPPGRPAHAVLGLTGLGEYVA